MKRHFSFLIVALLLCAVPVHAEFRFTVTADSREELTNFRHVLDQINANAGGEGAFHVCVGDIDDNEITSDKLGADDTYAVLQEKFGTTVDWYPVVGNHEQDHGGTNDPEITWLRSYYNTNLNGTVNPGPAGCEETTYSWDYGNAHFIVLNEYYTGTSDAGSGGDIVDALYNWLVADLNNNTKPAVFVFGHEPAYPKNRHVGDSLDGHPENRDRFWKLLNDYKVSAFLCGHTHVYSSLQQSQTGDYACDAFTWQIDVGNAGNYPSTSEGFTFVDVTVTDTTVQFDTWRRPNLQDVNPPTVWSLAESWSVGIEPHSPSPADGDTGVSTSPNLSATVTNPSATTDPVDVAFYGHEKPFTIVAIGDTQNYTQSGTAVIYDSMTQWIVDNAVEQNIVFVTHQGDIVDTWDNSTEWTNARDSMDILDIAGIPYGVLPGNHDKEDVTNDATLFNQTFHYSQYESQPWYGGHYGTTNNNNYQLFSAGGDDYIVLHLEDWPDEGSVGAVIGWADSVLTTYSDRKAIITTHGYMTSGGIYEGKWGSTLNIRNALVEAHDNVYFVLCGHSGESTKTTTVGTRQVHELLSCYHAGGWLRIMTFVPADNRVYVETYSPWLDQWQTDGNSEFDLFFPMSGGDFALIDSVVGVASGANASVEWSGLDQEMGYEWYVDVFDTGSSTTTSGPVWSFTTIADNVGPVISGVADSFITPFDNQVTISWDTDEPADSLVEYGEAPGSYTSQVSAVELVTGHSLVLTNLKPDTTYYYQITSADGAGNPTTTSEFSFTTSSGNHLPEAQAMSVGVVENGSVSFTLSATDEDTGDVLTFSIVTPPSNGTLDATNIPDVIYTPDADYKGADSFEFKAADATSWDTSTVPINVAAQVQGSDDSASVDEDSSVVIDVLSNDIAPPAATKSVESVTQGANGSISINGDNTVTYSPAADFNGTDTFTYVVRATEAGIGGDNLDTATVTVTVNPVNDAPVATDDTSTTNEDTAVVIAASTLASNDTDIDGDILSVTAVNGAVKGTVALDAGNVTFTPTPDVNGEGSFDYTVDDGNGGTDVGTVTVTIAPVNDDPVAAADTVATDEDTPLIFNASDLLGNDSDIDGDTPTFVGVSNAVNGTVAEDSGTITFTPTADVDTSGSFTYNISDGNGGSATGTVTIAINPINDAPVANGQVVAADNETPEAITLTASDVDDAVLTYSIVPDSGPSNGILSGSAPNVTYTANAGYEGTDSFQFIATDDDALDSDPVTVTINVSPVNHPPVAADDVASTNEDTPIDIDVITNSDSDPDGDALQVGSVTTQPSNGSASPAADSKSITYSPGPNFNGTDTFWYVANDGGLDSAPAKVTVTVDPVNDAPVAVVDGYSVDEDGSLSVAAAGVLANDSDVDGDAISAILVSGVSNGTLTLNADGSFDYAPDADFNDDDIFSYKANDSSVDSGTVLVTITVNAVNDAPVANSDVTVTTDEDVPVGITLTATDVEGDSLTYTIVSGPSNGSVSVGTGAARTYTPDPDFHGTDSFTFKANDGADDSNIATITITVNSVNDDPVAVADSASTTENISVVIDILNEMLYNDTDADFDSISFGGVHDPANGAVLDNGDGTVTFTPAADFYGEGSFEYDISDGAGGFATGTVTVNIAQDVPPYTEYFAFDERTATGTPSGDLSLTADEIDDTYEVIAEELSSNRKFRRLDHRWTFDIQQVSDSATFCIEAHHTGGEDFVFSYSLDNEDYTAIATITKTDDDDQLQEYALPTGLTGTVYIQVTDVDRSRNESVTDSISIDHMSIRCSLAVPEASNPVPGDGATDVDPDIVLSWTPGAGAVLHDVYFGTDEATLFLNADSSQQTGTTYDPGALVDGVIYYWAVDEFDAAGNPLATGVVWSFTAGAGCAASTMHVESIVLETVAADKGKKQGKATVTIYDNCGKPVAGAAVTGHFEGDFADSGTAQTDTNGQAAFVTSAAGAIKKPSFDFVVDGVTGTLVYNASASASSQSLQSE
jgi:VCBS repeat-containing protein